MLPRALAASALLWGIDAAALSDRDVSCRSAACQADDDAGSLLNIRGGGSDLGSDAESMDPGLWKTYPPEMLNVSMLLDDHNAPCSTVFLTTVLGTRPDPVHGGSRTPANLVYFLRLYRSVLSLPGRKAKVIFLHDFLPDELVEKYTTADGTASFVKVDISRFDNLTSLNDLRYYLFEEQVRMHPEWDTVFMTDTSDVTVVHNPCAFVERSPEKVYVHSQGQKFGSGMVRGEMEKLGGKYMEWYEQAQAEDSGLRYLNAGIQGGKRKVMLQALSQLNRVFSDPNLEARKKGKRFDCNMAAVNYVYRRYFPNDIVTGYPLHSMWLKHENRTDVYLKHK